MANEPADVPAVDQSAPPQGSADSGAPGAVPAAAGAVQGAGEGSPATPPAAAGALPEPGVQGTAGAGADGAKPQEPAKAPDWRDDRIRVLTARLSEEKARNAGAAPKSGDGTDGASDPTAPRPKSEAQIRAEIDAEIRANTAQADFNRRCNEVAQAGATQFTDFNTRVAELRRTVTDWNDPAQAGPYMRLLEAAMETGKAPALLYQLGGDLNETVRLMGLSPVKMAMELTKLANEVTADPANPKPIPRMSGAASAHGAIDPTDATRADNLSTEEWMRRRNEQIAKQPDRRVRA